MAENEVQTTYDDVIKAMRTVVDPELFLDIWTLGLIYDVKVEGDVVKIQMTFTSMGCPAGPYLVQEVREKTMALPGVSKAEVEIVFDPPWEPSEELKAALGIL